MSALFRRYLEIHVRQPETLPVVLVFAGHKADTVVAFAWLELLGTDADAPALGHALQRPLLQCRLGVSRQQAAIQFDLVLGDPASAVPEPRQRVAGGGQRLGPGWRIAIAAAGETFTTRALPDQQQGRVGIQASG